MQIAGAQRNPFRRSAMNALYQRSQGIPRLINIIADRALVAAFAKERMDVTAKMVHEAANEVQLGESQVRRVRWPWLLVAVAVVVVAVVAITTLYELPSTLETEQVNTTGPEVQTTTDSQPTTVAIKPPVELQSDANTVDQAETPTQAVVPEHVAELEADWLDGHQHVVWQGFAELWRHPGAAFSIEAACNGDNSRGYVCLNDQGSWSKIRRLGLPVVLVLQGQSPTYLLLHGIDGGRLLVGATDQLKTVSKESVEDLWLGSYLVVWPQAPEWPATVKRGDGGPAVDTIMEMATRVDVPYHGEQVFDTEFERWLKSYQILNGLEADGIVGRKTLLYLMTASIDDPQLLQSW